MDCESDEDSDEDIFIKKTTKSRSAYEQSEEEKDSKNKKLTR